VTARVHRVWKGSFIAGIVVGAAAFATVTSAADTAAAPAAVAPAKPGMLPNGQEGHIAFANQPDGILTWQTDGEKGIWVQAPNRQWYYGKFMSPCIGIDFVDTRLGFDTEPNGDFDKFSFVEVPGDFHQRCQLISLVTSNGPPTAKERKAAKAAAAKAAASATAPGSSATAH